MIADFKRRQRMSGSLVFALFASTVAVALDAPSAHAEVSARPAPAVNPATPVVPLAAHRATYNVTLLKSVGSKSPTSARGKVSYEFTGSLCEGYSQIFRQVTELQPGEGTTRMSDMRSATFEDADEGSFSYDVKTTFDNGTPEIVNGQAVKKGDDVLAIHLSRPTAQTIDVDKEVLFPTAHLKRIIAAAKAGQRILGVKVFDGSDDGKKVFDTTTIIGRPLTTPADDKGPHVASLDQVRRWPVQISYFEEDKKDESPAYSLGFELYENGVSRALRFDYGEFVLAGEITSLEMLPTKECPR